MTPAASTSSPSSSSSARRTVAGELLVAARVHHHVRHPAHQVLAEADLRVHPPGRREHLAGGEVAQVAGDGGRADVDRRPHDALAVAGPHGDDHAVAHGHGHRRVVRAARPTDRATARQRRAGPPQHRRGGRRHRHAVLVGHGRGQLVDDARDVGSEHRGSELEVVRGHQRVDHEGRQVEVLAHHLAVHLARRGHVDHDVADDARGAAQSLAGDERPTAAVVVLERARCAQGVPVVGDAPLGERSGRGAHLTPTADPAPAAHRVEVGAESPRCVEHRRAHRHGAVQPRRREHHARLARVRHRLPCRPGRRRRRSCRGAPRGTPRRGAPPRRSASSARSSPHGRLSRRHWATSSCAV